MHLEHCVQTWALYFEKDIRSIENVQRKATKMVNVMKNLRYEELLKNVQNDVFTGEEAVWWPN